jgi:hypothetical protein
MKNENFQPKGEPPCSFYLKSTNLDAEDVQKNDQILFEIKNKIEQTYRIVEKKIKGKNLIYYSCFNNKYAELLSKSILSLYKTNSKKFDILIITDLVTKKSIEKIKEISNYQIQYKITETPYDGVEASKLKASIYEYENIDLYENILYLDCDIIAIKNIDFIFNNSNLQYEKIYVSNNNGILSIEAHKFNPYIGFTSMSDDIFDLVKFNNQKPFNAGQFLFKNSLKMKIHFENLNWFMKNWPGKYFFEQSFMNYYFCSALLTDSFLDNLVFFVKKDLKKLPFKNSVFIHFVGPALEAEKKILNIKNYYKNYKIF